MISFTVTLSILFVSLVYVSCQSDDDCHIDWNLESKVDAPFFAYIHGEPQPRIKGPIFRLSRKGDKKYYHSVMDSATCQSEDYNWIVAVWYNFLGSAYPFEQRFTIHNNATVNMTIDYDPQLDTFSAKTSTNDAKIVL